MQKLAESWVRAEKEHHGKSLIQAIDELNETLGSQVNHSRVSEWRRGVYAPRQTVMSYLLNRALPWMLEQAGIVATKEQIQNLEALIWVVGVENGERFVELAASQKDV